MKKLITLTTAILTLSIGAILTNAQPARSKVRAKNKPVAVVHTPPVYNGNYNRRGVYTYTTTEIVHKRNGKFKNTYLHKVFPNGRTQTKLISSFRLHDVYPVNSRFVSETQYFAGQKYRVTYKITQFSNGTRTKLIHKRQRVW